MNTTTKNLMFLLASAPMVINGCTLTLTTDSGDEDNNNETSGDGDGDASETSDSMSTTGDGDGDATTGDGDGDGDPAMTTGDGDGDTTTGDGDGDPTTTGDGDGDPTTTGDGDTPCEGWAIKYVECYAEYIQNDAAYYAMYCETNLGYLESEYGADCAAAYEAIFACASTLDCVQFEMAPDACPDEFAAAEQACNFGP